ncbi:MAG TPA: YHS domain-containing protein, partial [Blattabacteriaceae bacterium]|nr:YHS domain-containing protein [Blattabacteriaceae bacterium]
MNSEKTRRDKTGRTLVKDPVCDMDVDSARAAGSSEYKGQTYYFCSPGCVKRFNADPEKYLTPKPVVAEVPKSQMVQIGGM